MMWRMGAAAGALIPLAAAALDRGSTTSGPVVWHLLGVPFEAGSMIAALCACIAVRFYVAQQDVKHRWSVDLPVSALTLMFTAAAIVTARPAPLSALLFGTGLGAVGAGLINIGKRYVDRLLGETGAASSEKQP